MPQSARSGKPAEKAPSPKHKPFKDYEPGYSHIDAKKLSKMPGQKGWMYLFVTIDRAARRVFIKMYPGKIAANARRFLAELARKAPLSLSKMLQSRNSVLLAPYEYWRIAG